MKSLENYGTVELNNSEMQTNGGWLPAIVGGLIVVCIYAIIDNPDDFLDGCNGKDYKPKK